MRLEKIRFYNINSLKGEHSISFDEGALADAGLFAITGATGAGKSTILDVITLALYNYVPRLGKISKTNIEKMGSIITHFTDEAWAEVEYTAHGSRYMSKWSISKTRTGTFRDYQMDLVLLPEGESVGLKKGEIPAKNTEIIGLTSDQFLKSILLSQGEFSTFLKANKDERAKLLEEITGTHIYRDLGRMAFEKTKDKKEKVETLRAQMKTILLLSEEELVQFGHELKLVKESAAIAQDDFTRKNELKILLNLKAQIKNQKVQIDKKQQTLILQKSEAERDLELLSRHKEARKFEQSIDQYADLEKTIQRLNSEVLAHQKNKDLYVQRKEALIAELASIVKLEVSESNFYEKMSAFEKEITDLDNSINTLKNQGGKVRSRIKALCEKHSFQTADQLAGKIKAKDAIAIIDARTKLIAINKGQDREDLQQKWTELQGKKTTLLQYVNQFDQAEGYRNKLVDLNQQIKFTKEAYLKDKDQWTLKKKDEELYEAELASKTKALEAAIKEAPYKAGRELLEDGKPCPLCGADHHPYAHMKELAEVGILSVEAEQLKNKLKTVQSELVQLQSNYLRSEKGLESLDNQLEIESINFKNAENARVAFTESHAWIVNVEDKTWKTEIDIFERESNQIREQLQNITEAHFLEDAKEAFGEMISVLQEFQGVQTERDAKFSGTSVSSEMNALQNKFTSAIQSIQQDAQMIKSKKAKVSDTKKELAQQIDKLEELRTRYTLEHVKDCQSLILSNFELNRINTLVESLNQKRVEITTLSSENEKAQSGYETSIAKLNESDKLELETVSAEALQVKIEELKLSLAEFNRIEGGLQNKLSHNEKEVVRYESYEAQLLKLQGENKSWILLSDLIGDAKGKKFSNYAQDLTLIHLLTRANARLASLSDRYSLSFRPEEDDLIVIDQYQGDTERAVKTLSGGETFLISLALALSLSDFASQKVRLESLFIDEGFGTLDQETLDIAMGTLEKLQHDSGKRIGIISHVESLKERISTQIIVQKNAQGYSTLEIGVI